MKLLRLVIPSALLMAGLYLYANAQVVPSPGPPTAIACAYNSSPVTLTSGQAGWVQCTSAGKLDVSTTASIAGFAPAGTFATLTATGSSASVALPAGTVVLFQNTGTTAVSCTLGVGSATALVSENIIQPASWLGITVGANTFGACIDQTGSASNVVVLSGGAGLPTGAGGGSSSGGGGGAVTVADGADVAQGTTTDGVCAGDATSGCTELSRLSRIAARLSTLITNLGTSTGTGQQGPTGSSPVVQAGLAYETVAASQTAQVLGGSGATGDFLSHCVIYPTSTTPGVVTVFDNASAAGTNVITFPGGASSVSNLAPIAIPVGAFSVAGPWKVTTGANLVAICYGKFS